MPKLHDMQCAIGRAILGEDETAIIEAILGEGLAEPALLQIHRNHHRRSLTQALKAVYPVVCRLVDERFFDFAADRFIQAHPPRQVCLFEYGDRFADFLAAFPPCAGLPYLPDVARLEWALNAVLHAPPEVPLAPVALAAVPAADYPRLVFRLQPALRLLESPWPLDRIWQANQAAAAEVPPLDLAAGGCRLEIRQQDEAVVFRRLEEADFALRRALLAGHSLEEATALLLAEDPLFDLAPALRRLFAEGLITGFAAGAAEAASSRGEEA